MLSNAVKSLKISTCSSGTNGCPCIQLHNSARVGILFLIPKVGVETDYHNGSKH
jgi:hypothetical protein